MRAVIIASDEPKQMDGIHQRGYPASLMHIMDRPFIQHTVEMLVDMGMKEFDFILCHFPEKIEELLGDGTRWGVNFRFHLVRDPERPYKVLKTLQWANGEAMLIGHADRLPDFRSLGTRHVWGKEGNVFYASQSSQEKSLGDLWTGWAWLTQDMLSGLKSDCDHQEFIDFLTGQANQNSKVQDIRGILSMRSYPDLMRAHMKVLSKSVDGLIFAGREIEPHVWVCRNVSLHPTAKVNPPVYIGENTQIAAGTELGPNAVIGRECILDKHSIITNSIVLPSSYVGEGLELSEVIVNKNRLINLRLDAELSIQDDFIISAITSKPMVEMPKGFFSTIIAFILLCLLGPVMLLTALLLKVFRKGPVVYKKEVVRLPAAGESNQWRTFKLWSFTAEERAADKSKSRFRDFFLRFLPSLLSVIRGDMRLMGVRPLHKDDVDALPSDWKSLYLSSKVGIISEALINHGMNPNDDELYSSEAVYSVSSSLRHDLLLLCKYFFWLLHIVNPITPEKSNKEELHQVKN